MSETDEQQHTDLLVEQLGLGALKGEAHQHKRIRKSLHTKTNGTMSVRSGWSESMSARPHVGVAGLLAWVVVDVNDLVEVARGDLGTQTHSESRHSYLDYIMQLAKVERLGL